MMLKRRKGPKLVRRQVAKKKEFPRGGHVPDPPEDCPYKKKFEEGGKWWAESVLCAYYCQDSRTCKAFKDYLFDTKQERINRRKDSED